MNGKRRAQTTERRRKTARPNWPKRSCCYCQEFTPYYPISAGTDIPQYVCSCKTISSHCRRTMLTHPLTHARTHARTQSIFHSSTPLITLPSSTPSLTQSLIHTLIHSLIHSFTHTHSFTHSPTHSTTHPLTVSLSHSHIQSVLYAVNIFSRFKLHSLVHSFIFKLWSWDSHIVCEGVLSDLSYC